MNPKKQGTNDDEKRKNWKQWIELEPGTEPFKIVFGVCGLLVFAAAALILSLQAYHNCKEVLAKPAPTSVAKPAQTLDYPPRGSVIQWTLITDGGPLSAGFVVSGTVTQVTTPSRTSFPVPKGTRLYGVNEGKGVFGNRWVLVNGDTERHLAGKSLKIREDSANANGILEDRYLLTVEQ